MWQQKVFLDTKVHNIDYFEPPQQRLFLNKFEWECAAGLVQSPASTNSESSSTSTPDQCPTSPFCEMPSSRNGNAVRPTQMWSSVKSSTSPDREGSLWNPIMNQGYNSVSPNLPASDFLAYPVENMKQEQQQQEEFFLGGRNGLVIDEKVLALQASRNSSQPSKIGNFMNLLRQSDRPIQDCTTAAASCSHLSQLLSSQEAPEMWIAHSSRLPAMLSEVLPGKSSEHEQKHKRKLLEDVDSVSTVTKEEEEALSSEKATNDTELFSKRTKFENSNTFPFKMQVRKEKLGERISALQQLVSPFGKTDTASVLLEAIGYIKFLHEQVQVLSSPYMKPPGTGSGRHNEAGKETKQDLRSRGLCLVPISCTLQVANDNGADYWTPSLHSGLK